MALVSMVELLRILASAREDTVFARISILLSAGHD